VIAGANVPDARLLKDTIEAVVVERPQPSSESPQHLSLSRVWRLQDSLRVASLPLALRV
jgi:hypothetical protein